MATPNEIKQAGRRISRLVETLALTKAMVRGSFTTVHRRCGKQTCWCADPGQKGHACTRITWTENGISRTRTVHQEDRERLRKAVNSYRMYRRNRRQLRSEEELLEKLLDAHEKETAQSSVNK
jgi:uncharacterized protein YjiS (DUF1127 family)